MDRPEAADTEATDTVQRLGLVVARLRDLLAHAARQLEDVSGLPAAQVAVLRAVGDGVTSVSGVAERLLTHVSNASRTVDALVRAGLLDRARDPDDRRTVVLAVTEAGATRLDDLDRHRDVVMDRALANLTPAEGTAFVDLLERFVADLDLAVRDRPEA